MSRTWKPGTEPGLSPFFRKLPGNLETWNYLEYDMISF